MPCKEVVQEGAGVEVLEEVRGETVLDVAEEVQEVDQEEIQISGVVDHLLECSCWGLWSSVLGNPGW